MLTLFFLEGVIYGQELFELLDVPRFEENLSISKKINNRRNNSVNKNLFKIGLRPIGINFLKVDDDIHIEILPFIKN